MLGDIQGIVQGKGLCGQVENPCLGSDVREVQVFYTLFDFPTHYLTTETWHPRV